MKKVKSKKQINFINTSVIGFHLIFVKLRPRNLYALDNVNLLRRHPGGGDGGRGRNSHTKRTGLLAVPFRGENAVLGGSSAASKGPQQEHLRYLLGY